MGLLILRAVQPALTASVMALLVGRVGTVGGVAAFDAVLGPLLLLGFVFIVGHIIDAVLAPLNFLAQARIDGAYRTNIIRLVTRLDTISELESPQAQRLLRLACADPENWTERTPGQAALARMRWAGVLFGLVASCTVLAWYAWWLVPLLLVPAAVNRFLRDRQAFAFTAVWRGGIDEGRRAAMWEAIITTPDQAKEVRTYGLGIWVIDRIQQHTTTMQRPLWVIYSRLLRNEWTQFLLIGVPLAVAYALAARDTVDGRATVAMVTVVLAASWSVFQWLQYSEDVRDIAAGTACERAYTELMDLLATSPRPPADTPAGMPTGAPPTVQFDAVSFRYPGSDRAVLDRLDLDIRPGELLAVVGLNGAGKSTLAKLLVGLHEPTSGRITADGVDITAMGLPAWRSRTAVVFQDFVRYHLSAADNVAFSNGGTPRDAKVLAAAARDAGFDEVLDRLPRGWATPLARSRTGGVDLSGGQWQQVCLARAFYAVRTGAKLLLLDEPTAHLDVRTEFEVFDRLTKRTAQVSTVLISHRLSTVRMCDRIVLIDGGRVAESGSHEELVALGGAYARMWAIQAERFKRGYDDRIDESDAR